jgi:DNA-binding transcriptional regulator YdaS (Cro superfamily)
MTLEEFFRKQPRGSKAEMAKQLGISRTWFSLLIAGTASPSAALCVAIEKLTKRKVKRSELRSDLFGE